MGYRLSTTMNYGKSAFKLSTTASDLESRKISRWYGSLNVHCAFSLVYFLIAKNNKVIQIANMNDKLN